MDLIHSKTIDVTAMALDGLMRKHRALSGNIANAEVEGYQRQDVSFENQLSNILEKEYEQEAYKSANSKISITDPQSVFMSKQMSAFTTAKKMEAMQAYSEFRPIVSTDNSPATSPDGSNVSIEKEMIELAKNTTRYTVLTEALSKKLAGLSETIKGAM